MKRAGKISIIIFLVGVQFIEPAFGLDKSSPYSLFFPSAKAQRVKKTVLPDGLTVLVKEEHRNPIVALEALIKVGTEYEADRLCGIRNFCQSLILKGTKKRSSLEIALQLEFVGGLIDTSTAQDFVEVSVLTRPEGLDVGLDILADVIQNPVFPDQEVGKERRAILAQIEQLKDDKFEYAYELFKGALYQAHPYGRPILGTKQSVEAIQRDDLVNFHKSHYLANMTVISVVGDVKAKDIIGKISKAFKGFKPGELPEPIGMAEPKRTKSTEVTETKDVEQAFLILGFLAPSVKAQDYPVLKVINSILGSGMSSRLYEDLREVSGLAYELGSFFPTRKGSSHFAIYLGTRPENLSRAKELVLSQIERIKAELVNSEELRRAKAFCKGAFALDHQKNSRQAWYLAWYEILNLGYKFDRKYPDLIQQVTREDVQRVAKKYFKHHTLAILRPAEGKSKVSKSKVSGLDL